MHFIIIAKCYILLLHKQSIVTCTVRGMIFWSSTSAYTAHHYKFLCPNNCCCSKINRIRDIYVNTNWCSLPVASLMDETEITLAHINAYITFFIILISLKCIRQKQHFQVCRRSASRFVDVY